MRSDSHPIRLRNEDVTWQLVDGQVIVLDRRTWAYLSINDSGALLWPLLVDGATTRDLVAALRRAFSVDEDRARKDVTNFLATLREYDLVVGEAGYPASR